MRLILVRHGHVPGIDPPRFRGHREVPLTDLGRRQAELTGAAIASRWAVDAVFTSPLGRCIDTGAAIAAATGAPTGVLSELVDFDYGAWSWRTLEEVRSEAPELFDLWFREPWRVDIPGGDTLQALAARAADALRAMMRLHGDGTVVAVAHDSTNRALLLQCLGMSLDGYWRLMQSPCCLNEIDIGPGIRVHLINGTAHLDERSDGQALPG
ncbi:putative phosphoglycerate mutase [Hephaestia caeni]|uniref:Putative phosphoglycerate mutase n=1 Tax=Hephaestia caeni TaxID=645617 RepID=A0A397PKR6_9SPHN|nr:histidine phosphatase family protein [Hephaestia caeni]RIA46714.1 putative phosphoglycerate mutase [Hephaestia caeni]